MCAGLLLLFAAFMRVCQAMGVSASIKCPHAMIYEDMALRVGGHLTMHFAAIPLAVSIFALALLSQWDFVTRARKSCALPKKRGLVAQQPSPLRKPPEALTPGETLGTIA